MGQLEEVLFRGPFDVAQALGAKPIGDVELDPVGAKKRDLVFD